MCHVAKTVLGVSDQVQHKRVCTATENNGLEFLVSKVEGLYHLYSKNKGAD